MQRTDHLTHQLATYWDEVTGKILSVSVDDLQIDRVFERVRQYPLRDADQRARLFIKQRGKLRYLSKPPERFAADTDETLDREQRKPFHDQRREYIQSNISNHKGPLRIYSLTRSGFAKTAFSEAEETEVTIARLNDYVWQHEGAIQFETEQRGNIHRRVSTKADLVGRSSKRAVDDRTNPLVIIEFIHSHLPTKATFEGYLTKSLTEHMLVIFDPRSHANDKADKSNYFTSYKEQEGLRIVYYIKDGQFWKNDTSIPNVDHDKFCDEISNSMRAVVTRNNYKPKGP